MRLCPQTNLAGLWLWHMNYSYEHFLIAHLHLELSIEVLQGWLIYPFIRLQPGGSTSAFAPQRQQSLFKQEAAVQENIHSFKLLMQLILPVGEVSWVGLLLVWLYLLQLFLQVYCQIFNKNYTYVCV